MHELCGKKARGHSVSPLIFLQIIYTMMEKMFIDEIQGGKRCGILSVN